MLLSKVENAWKIAKRVCHPVDNLQESPEHFEILCGNEEIDGFDFPINDNYPLVLKARGVVCSDYTFYVNDTYLGGLKTDGETFRLTTDKLLPWYEEALVKYVLDGTDISMKRWVFTDVDGNMYPYAPGIELNLRNGTIEPYNDVSDKFSTADARINYYADIVLDKETKLDDNASVPTNSDELEDMMFNLIVPRGLFETMYRYVYGSERHSSKRDRQAVLAWLAIKLQTPVKVFDKVFTLPQ